MRLNPFRALRPAPGLEAKVAAPPYDVVNREEAARLAEGNPLSFLHIGRADIDLPAQVDPHDERVYAKARQNLERFVRERTLVREDRPTLYLYRQIMDGRSQTGVVGCVHVDDYERDVIRKHEHTRKDKEDDRTRHVLSLNANAEPVFLMHQDRADLVELTRDGMTHPALYDFTAPDGVQHTVWRIADGRGFVQVFGRVPHAYVADGHHRSASAWRAGKELRALAREPRPDAEYNWFLAVLFPASQLKILPYHRLLRDLGGLSPEAAREKLAALGRWQPTADPAPREPGSFGIYLAGRWHLLALDRSSIDPADRIGSLDVSLLHDRILGPLFGIGDIRTDPRIDFVGGIRGIGELERRVDSGEMALAVAMYPTTVDQLMAVSDAGQIMPPKSTWFEPKLKSGLFVHTLD